VLEGNKFWVRIGLSSLIGGLRGGERVEKDGAELAELKLGTSDTLVDPEKCRSYMNDLPDEERFGELGDAVVLDMTERTERDRARLRRELERGETIGGERAPVEGLGGLELI
jgi:hypothetical protein